jgi:hypothetical protein
MTKREKPSDPVERDEVHSRAGSSIVFCGDPAQVGAGFAVALKLMGVAPAPDVSKPDPPRPEDDVG